MLTNNLKKKIEEIECLKLNLFDSFNSFSHYERPRTIRPSDEELKRKKAILEKLKKSKSDITKLLKEVDSLVKQSQKLKSQISNNIQEELNLGFNLSWEVPEEIDDFSLKGELTLVLKGLSANSILSLELRDRIENAIEKMSKINNEEFLKNYNAVTVKPLVDECTEYIKNVEIYGSEFEELETEYKILCSDLNIIPKIFKISESSIADLKKEISNIYEEILKNNEQEYIADTIDEVMKEMGYDLIGSREVTKKSGKRFCDELYTFKEGTVVNIRYDSHGKIAMELGGIDNEDRLPSSSEALKLEDEMIVFCDKFIFHLRKNMHRL